MYLYPISIHTGSEVACTAKHGNGELQGAEKKDQRKEKERRSTLHAVFKRYYAGTTILTLRVLSAKAEGRSMVGKCHKSLTVVVGEGERRARYQKQFWFLDQESCKRTLASLTLNSTSRSKRTGL